MEGHRTRLSAAERREQIVGLALPEFARTGYFGTSTEAIARKAAISHAYLFRLFGTKKDLFLACAERTHARTIETFRVAATTWREQPRCPSILAAMGMAYRRMLSDRELLQMHMQVWAACSDAEIRTTAREHYRDAVEEIERLSGATGDQLRAFVATGMLLNVAAALSLEDVAAEQPWVRRLLFPLDPDHPGPDPATPRSKTP